MGLSIQQREREIALLRAVAATPGQIRRMIAWEAAIVGLVGSAAGIWPGAILGRALADGLVRHGIAPPYLSVHAGWLPIAAAVAGGIMAALLAVLAAGRRAARVSPTRALAHAAVEPRLLGPGRVIGGLLALAGAAPLFAVSATTGAPDVAAPTSEMTALFLVVAVGCLGPIVAPAARAALARRRLPGVLKPAHRHAALLVGQHAADADRRHELHPAVQRDHGRPRRHPAEAGRPVRRARHHEHRPRLAGGDGGRRARHSRRAVGGRADPHDTRSELGRLR
jgi:predicted lysophospholipase L1 biosynthesis ABC-type transport system permease subunit